MMDKNKRLYEKDLLTLYANLEPLTKPLSQMSSKERNQTEAYKEYAKFMRQRPGAKAKRREYNQQPEIKAKQREYNRRPKARARRKAYQRVYNQRPKVIIKRRKYARDRYQRPNIKLKFKEQQRTSRQKPKVKVKINKSARKYCRDRRKTDLNFKLGCNLRTRIYDTLKNNYKSARTMELVGCSIEYLKDYLESQFDDEMSWANYGKWHIDHILPCASFDLSKEEEQRKCFNYTNLQPLWAFDNFNKSAKIGRN